MTFLEAKTGIDHAVVVTGIRENQGNIFVQYYDPTTNQTGERQNSVNSNNEPCPSCLG